MFKVGDAVKFDLNLLTGLSAGPFYNYVLNSNNAFSVLFVGDEILRLSTPGYGRGYIELYEYEALKYLRLYATFKKGSDVKFLDVKGVIEQEIANAETFKYKVLFENGESAWFTKEGYIYPFMKECALEAI